jgi:mRNA interferase MazF
VTNASKGYPFEVTIPAGAGVSGVVLSDQVRSLSWVERRAALIGDAPDEVVEDARAKIATLIGIE